jgi:hypothetical protein
LKRVYLKTARAALLVLLTTNASLGLGESNNHYRWLNDRGEPVYSDRPPPKDVDYEVISSASSVKRVVAAEEGAVPPEIQPRVGNQFDQVDSAEAARSKKNPELCQKARSNLESLNSAAKIKVRNNQGEVRYLNPEEMEVERHTARGQISVYCE